MTTTINTGTYLLAILQERYNHHQGLADSYKKLANETTANGSKADYLAEYKKHQEQAIGIYCDVNKLDLMEQNGGAHVDDLMRNYRVYKAMERTKDNV